MSKLAGTRDKVAGLSPDLQRKIVFGERNYKESPETPVSNFLVRTKLHCNAGRTVDAGLALRNHCDAGGRIFLSMSGAGSSFQLGRTIAELMRAGKIAAISGTGANMEESLYRLVADSQYAYIPEYTDLTPENEKELDRAGLRRITDTFLPEDESVRVVLPELEKLWREAEQAGESLFWHEFFFRLFERELLVFDPEADPGDCWLFEAWKQTIPVIVPGLEDSTMGNIFTYYTYNGEDRFLARYRQEKPVSPDVVQPSIRYMHQLAEWYMQNSASPGLAFVQLGGGIAADFPICVVPHLKKDYLADESLDRQDEFIRPWAGFVEIHGAPMSQGSYTGAGYKEKITWGKLEVGSFGFQIFGDYTEHFPAIAALVLRW